MLMLEVKVKVKVHTLDIAPLRSESLLQKRSDSTSVSLFNLLQIRRASSVVLHQSFLFLFLLIVLCMVVSDCLEGLVSDVTYSLCRRVSQYVERCRSVHADMTLY